MFGLALLFYYGYRFVMGGAMLDEKQTVSLIVLIAVEIVCEILITIGLYSWFKKDGDCE